MTVNTRARLAHDALPLGVRLIAQHERVTALLAKVGDVMRVEVEKIGTLSNPVVAATR